MDAAREQTTVPQFVGRYEVLVPIASGGMATVYLARSRGAGGFARDVALKLTHMHLRESPDFQSLLLEEAKLASAIRHNNVVSVLDVGDDPLGMFLVMDYVEGDTFSGLVRRSRTVGEPLEQRFAMKILLDALAGLHAAHETRDAEGRPLAIVHRDFSPQNILVGTDGITKLTDFGIAKAATRGGNTSTGILKGKIAYMSPEQARGTPLDRRADVWAAGVLAWEIVMGRSLWPRDSEDVATLIKLVTEAPPRLRDLVPSVSEALDAAVAKALAMEPDARWPTAEAFAKALAASVPEARADELAPVVRGLVGPKLAKRRAQVLSMGALRAKMGELTEATVMTPSGLQSRVPSARPEIPSSPPFAKVEPLDAEVTYPHPRRPRWVVVVAAGVVVLGGIALALALATRGLSASASASAAQSEAPSSETPFHATPPTTGSVTNASPPAVTATVAPGPTTTHVHHARSGSTQSTVLAPSPY